MYGEWTRTGLYKEQTSGNQMARQQEEYKNKDDKM